MWKRIALVAACALVGCSKDDAAKSSAPAAAPAAPVAREHPKLDDQGSGSAMSETDRAEKRRERMERMRQKLDANGDGKISVDELKNAPGRMKFDDPAAVDTDHDGFISPEELDAAMKARREQMRAKWGSGHVTGSDEAPM